MSGKRDCSKGVATLADAERKLCYGGRSEKGIEGGPNRKQKAKAWRKSWGEKRKTPRGERAGSTNEMECRAGKKLRNNLNS